MESQYPEITEKANDISALIKNIEISYIKVRTERVPELTQQLKDIDQNTNGEKEKIKLIGSRLFTFRDTYGLTQGTMQIVLNLLKLKELVIKD